MTQLFSAANGSRSGRWPRPPSRRRCRCCHLQRASQPLQAWVDRIRGRHRQAAPSGRAVLVQERAQRFGLSVLDGLRQANAAGQTALRIAHRLVNGQCSSSSSAASGASSGASGEFVADDIDTFVYPAYTIQLVWESSARPAASSLPASGNRRKHE